MEFDSDWAALEELHKSLKISEKQNKEWTILSIAVPADFIDIFEGTMQAYKYLLENDHNFPALEAMIMEARNAIPQHVWSQYANNVS